MEREEINDSAIVVGERVMERFQELYEQFSEIGDIRGLGAMCALEFVTDRDTKEPDKELTDLIIKEAQGRGMLARKAGAYDNVIRLLMPLVIKEDRLNEDLTSL